MESRSKDFIIRKAAKDEWEEAMAVAYRTFRKFEADEYTPEGVRNFVDFISDNGLYKMFLIDEYLLWVAVADEKIVGLISIRSKRHISLLFVDEKYHHRGIATALMQEVIRTLTDKNEKEVTVNSSPYAVGFYHKMGFEDIGKEHMDSGMIITPMRRRLK